MEPIHSGTTTERIVRTGLMVVLFGGFGIAYLMDGFGGYARKNAKQYVEDKLGLTADPLPEINPELTRARALGLKEKYPGRVPGLLELTEEFGEPGLEHEGKAYFFGPGGVLWLDSQQSIDRPWGWDDGSHTEMDLRMQQWIGYALSVLALVFIIHFVRVISTRATLSDEGLKLCGHPLIPFSGMRHLHSEHYKKKGWVELEYEGGKGTVQLDDYVIKGFKPIITEICQRCGFTNPLTIEDADDPGADDDRETDGTASSDTSFQK